jgi:hypothetical protein
MVARAAYDGDAMTMHTDKSATFRVGDQTLQVERYEIHFPETEPVDDGTFGFSVGEFVVDLRLGTPARLPVGCSRCGQGRFVTLARWLRGADERWAARHACPRGTVAGRWILHVPGRR